MAFENIELVDRDYENCSKEAMPRQIKTRSLSFRNIVEKFRQFRIRRLERKMEKIVDKTLSSDYSKRKIADKLMSKSLKLARLEEKIRILQKENVPSKFVKSRAIKLRNYMMENTVKSAAGLYFVDLDDSDVLGFVSADESALNNPESIAEADVPVEAPAVEDNNSIDLSSQVIDRDSLTDSINNEFSNLENGNELDSEGINNDTVSSVIENSLSDVGNNSINDIVIPEEGNNNNNNNLVSALKDIGVVPEEEGNITVSEATDNPELNNSVVVPEEEGNITVSEATDNPELNNSVVAPEKEGNITVSEATDNPELNNSVVAPEEEGNKTVSEATDNPELNNSVVVPEVAPTIEETATDTNNEISKETVESVINDTLVDVSDDVKDDGATFVSPEEVSMVVGNNDIADQADSSESIEDSLSEDVSTVVSEDTISDKNADEEAISSDKIKQFMDSAFKNVSKSEVSNVNPEKFDENGGIRFKHHYTPMTDAEIAESRNKINSLEDFVPEKNDEAIANLFTSLGDSSTESDDRSMPVIVESRVDEAGDENGITDYTFEDSSSVEVEPEKEDSDAAVIDVSETRQSKISEFNKLKDKILELREKSSAVSKDKIDAQTSAREIALKAEEAKKKAEQSDADLQNKVEQMRRYCEGLEQDCENTIRETSQIQDDIKNNSSIIEMQEDKYDENTRMIDEIDRLMGSEEISGPRKK